MIKKKQTLAHYSDESLKEILNSQTEIRGFRDWQIIYSVQTNLGMKAEDIAGILGKKKSKVLRVIQLYHKSGIHWRPYGLLGVRREHRRHLTIEEEAALLLSIESDALSGNILTYKQIKTRVEYKEGKPASDDYIWDLFSRHNWKKKVPRPSHPKADKQAQETYKKLQGEAGSPQCRIFQRG